MSPTPFRSAHRFDDNEPADNPVGLQIIESFAVHIWLSALLAVGFAGAMFAYFGVGLAIVTAMAGFVASLFSLNIAYHNRHINEDEQNIANGIVMAGMILAGVALFSKGLVVALLCILLFLHLALNISFRQHRQVYFGLLISFMALMVGATQTFSTGYLVFMLLFCLFSCFYLGLVFVDKQRYQHTPSDNELDVTANRLQYVGEARYRDKLVLASMISLMAGALYLITPHFSAGNLGRLPLEGFGKYDNLNLEKQILPENTDLQSHFYPAPNGDGESGKTHSQQAQQSTSQKDPNGIPKLQLPTPKEQLDNSIYYYVKSNKPRYLQHDVMTYFDGHSWQRLQYGWRQVQHDTRQFLLYPDKANASIAITVAKDVKQHVLTTDNTVAVRFPSQWLASDYYDTLKTGENLVKDTRYELLVDDEFVNNRLIDKQQAKPDDKDLQLPNDLDPRIATLTAQVVAGKTSDSQKALALENHLHTAYQYTLDTLPNQNNIPLADFLFHSKRGHCEYFATALTVMLRQQHIPARYVTGFMAHDYNPVTGYYEVKGTNAHAWVEAYLDGHWQVMEATIAYEQANNAESNAQQNATTQQTLKDYLDNLQKQEERVAKTQSLTLKQRLQLLWYDFWSMLLAGFASLMQVLKIGLPIAFGIGVVVFGLYALYRRHRVAIADWQAYRQLQQLKHINDPKLALHSYARIYQGLLSRHGITREQGQTIETFAELLTHKGLMNAQQAKDWTTFANQHFYATPANSVAVEQIRPLFIQLYNQAQQYFKHAL